jgi:hypothetical protein
MSAPESERGKQLGAFLGIMREQPLSLALVVMNFVLLGYLFYSGSSAMSQRQETTGMIVKWQQDTDRLMASCVSADIMQMVLDAMQRAHSKTPPELK